jgi:hypothetical protein
MPPSRYTWPLSFPVAVRFDGNGKKLMPEWRHLLMYRLHIFLKAADIEMGVLGLADPYALAIFSYGFEVSHVGYVGYCLHVLKFLIM